MCAERFGEHLDLRLGQFLKLADMVGSGGEAKIVIQEGAVEVNGQVETRRGRHLQRQDRVTYKGCTVSVDEVLQSVQERQRI